jgi:membrane dipeptidase
MLVADAHSDLLEELAFAEDELGEANPLRSRWVPPLERGGVVLQVCAIYADPELDASAGLREVLRQARSFHRAVRENADRVIAVRRAGDLADLGVGRQPGGAGRRLASQHEDPSAPTPDDHRIGLLLALEGAAALQQDPHLIEILAELGVRMASLTWNERNAFAAGCEEDGGLTPLGERLVDRILELGMAMDLAHASQRTFWDVLERDCADRVLVSHAACRAVYDHPRNLDDDQLAALARRGGVLGLMPHPFVVDPDRWTVDRFLAHVDHAVTVMGVEHVALGGDFLHQIMHALGLQDQLHDGMRMDAALDGLEGPQDYPALAEALQQRDWSDASARALFGGNLLRLLEGTLPA